MEPVSCQAYAIFLLACNILAATSIVFVNKLVRAARGLGASLRASWVVRRPCSGHATCR